MRSAVTYLKSWFGRFEAVSHRRPDPWLWLPAMALLMLGCLMVLNTTYFMSQEKTGDAFHFFKLHLLHLGVGLVMLMLLSQFSLRGLRRLVIPLLVIVVRDAADALCSGAGDRARRRAPMAPARPLRLRAGRSSQNSRWCFSSRIF